jgi:hypothetical protein
VKSGRMSARKLVCFAIVLTVIEFRAYVRCSYFKQVPVF